MSEQTGNKFAEKSFVGKIQWICKFCIALATFGFVYPNIMHD